MKNILFSFISSGLLGGDNTPYIRKIRFLNIGCLLLALFTHALIFRHLSQQLSYIALLDISILILLVIIIIYLRGSKNLESASDLFLLLLVNISQYFLITGVLKDFAIIWIFSFPVIASFLKTEKKAFLWSLAMTLGLLIVSGMGFTGVISLVYGPGTLLYISVLFLLFALLVYYLVNTNKIGEKILVQKSSDLYKTNILLAKEVRERKETELVLKQENVRDEAIFSSIGEGMIVLDQDYFIVMINNTASEMLDIKKDSIIGKSLFDIVHFWNASKKRVPRGHDPLSRAFDDRKNTLTSNFLLGKSAELALPVSLTISPIILYNKVVGGILMFRDITKEKDVDRMKSEFISIASHQLRTPLTAMKWFLEMLLTGDVGPISEEQKKYIQNISDSNEKEIALVNSLLNISRIESGRIIIDPTPTNINELIMNTIATLQMKIDEKSLSLIKDLSSNLPEIPVDQKLFQEIILNIVVNAIKYTPDHGAITVSTTSDQNDCVITIRDTGYGIPEKDKSRIFERFFRASNVVKTVTDGTGLGLYLVKAIVDASGGSIRLESKEGVGTTFIILFPLKGMKIKKGEVSLT